MKWLAREQFDTWSRVNGGEVTDPAGLLKFATVEQDATMGDARRVRVVCSTSAPDRENDVIAQTGWQLQNYKKNPVALFGHDYHSLPIAKAVAIQQEAERLVMDFEFATAAEYPFADTCYKLVKGGYLNAVSVGFRPLTYLYNEERRGYDFATQELLELSFCPVGAHPQALVEARDAGIDLTLLKQWHEGLGEQLKALEPEPGPEIKIIHEHGLDIEVTTGKTPAGGIKRIEDIDFTLDAAKKNVADPDDVTRPWNWKPINMTQEEWESCVGRAFTSAVKPLFDDAQKAPDVESTLADTAEKIAGLVKQGRVLSATNENKIRSAVTALSEVLGALDTTDGDGKATSPPVQKHEPAGAGGEDIDLENIVLPTEPTPAPENTISEKDLQQLVDAVGPMVQRAIERKVTEHTGRVF